MICKNCGKTYFNAWTKSGKSDFCSSFCAHKFSSLLKRKDTNKKVSETLRKKFIKKYYLNPKKCVVCGNEIPYERKNCSTCSTACGTILRKKAAQGNLLGKKGGYRKGSGRSKSGYYNNVFMASTFELVYYIYQIEHNKNIIRNEKIFSYTHNGKKHTYLPDFFVDGKYIEIKGVYTKLVDIKAEAVKNSGFEIEVLYENDLEKMMQYVDHKYGTKHTANSNNYYKLYQNYKPSFEYKCDTCGKSFSTDKKRKTITGKVYCCKKCSDKRKKRLSVRVEHEQNTIMNKEQHRQLIDYIFKVFKQDNQSLDIIDRRYLTFEEAWMIIEEIKKDTLNAQFEQILADNENVLERLKTRGDDYYFSREFIEKAVNEFMGQVNTEHE